MLDLIEQRTAEDGSDTGQWLHSLFEILNTPEDRRLRTLDEDLAQFPYVNGDLFAERLPVPAFNKRMRNCGTTGLRDVKDRAYWIARPFARREDSSRKLLVMLRRRRVKPGNDTEWWELMRSRRRSEVGLRPAGGSSRQ